MCRLTTEYKCIIAKRFIPEGKSKAVPMPKCVYLTIFPFMYERWTKVGFLKTRSNLDFSEIFKTFISLGKVREQFWGVHLTALYFKTSQRTIIDFQNCEVQLSFLKYRKPLYFEERCQRTAASPIGSTWRSFHFICHW